MTNIIQESLAHLYLVFIATIIAVAIGILLGVLAYKIKYMDKIILPIVDILQTIPSLAMLSILMIVLGLGNTTLITGLVLYSLLPITRNTYTGLKEVAPHLKDAAKGMGMSGFQRLIYVELPLSFPLIFTGIKIALVTSFSIAVLGVLIGAGGLGLTIYTGIRSHNTLMVLQGAIPVSLFAMMFDIGMTAFEKKLIKKVK